MSLVKYSTWVIKNWTSKHVQKNSSWLKFLNQMMKPHISGWMSWFSWRKSIFTHLIILRLGPSWYRTLGIRSSCQTAIKGGGGKKTFSLCGLVWVCACVCVFSAQWGWNQSRADMRWIPSQSPRKLTMVKMVVGLRSIPELFSGDLDLHFRVWT